MIGWIAGEKGAETVRPFFADLFLGVLCLFLLDMGLSAGRGLRQGGASAQRDDRQLWTLYAARFGLYRSRLRLRIEHSFGRCCSVDHFDGIRVLHCCPNGNATGTARSETLHLLNAVAWGNLPV